MSERQYPKTFAAAKRAEKSQWAIGDALLLEIGPPRAGARQETWFQECAAELVAEGMPYSVGHLQNLRNIAHKFDLDRRRSGLTVEVAREAGTPGVLDKAEKMAKEEGVKLSKRYVRKVRKATAATTRRNKGLKAVPRKQKKAAAQKAVDATPTSEIRRTSDILDLELTAEKAEKLGRDLVKKLAGVDLTAEERADLLTTVKATVNTWQVVQEAIENPISGEVEEFLRGVS
jgi:hypothetical protein